MDAISYSYADKQAKRINKFINDPDSTSGVLTVPKVIASGENITVPAGRVAVLPNVQIDGTLNIEGEVFIPSGATLSKVVELDGDQTIDDVKTFTSSPIVPTPTTGTQAVNKTYADTKTTLAEANNYDLGVGQTWQDVTASRVVGTTYTNTTGKPIFISVYTAWTSSNTLTLTIGGVATQLDGVDQGFTYPKVVAIIPNNITYSVSGWAAGKWFELR